MAVDTKQRRGRRPVISWFFVVAAAAAAVYCAYPGVNEFVGYQSGTPTRATIVHCHDDSGVGEGKQVTWSIGGASQKGPLSAAGSHCSVGSSLDVRVSGGAAYTATPWIQAFGLGVFFLGWSILFYYVARPRRSRPEETK